MSDKGREPYTIQIKIYNLEEEHKLLHLKCALDDVITCMKKDLGVKPSEVTKALLWCLGDQTPSGLDSLEELD
jgi:hypothetical protein